MCVIYNMILQRLLSFTVFAGIDRSVRRPLPSNDRVRSIRFR